LKIRTALQLQCTQKEIIMRTATFPAVRTTPEARALVESTLRPGETLSTFIEETILQKAQWRKEDQAFYARAMAASKRIDEGGPTYTLEEAIASLRAQIQRAREKQSAPDLASTPTTQRKAAKPSSKKSKAAA
jgi:hypothetical protein